jgi:hypothetical protein
MDMLGPCPGCGVGAGGDPCPGIGGCSDKGFPEIFPEGFPDASLFAEEGCPVKYPFTMSVAVLNSSLRESLK